MSTLSINSNAYSHTRWEVSFFQVVFVFALLLTIPLDAGYYHHILHTNWLHPHFQDIFQLTHAVPTFFTKAQWGWSSYAGWGLALVASVVITAVWSFIDKGRAVNIQNLYYWLRVILRYRLALALLGFGVIKLIPVQLPGPSISDLHTPYGDLYPWKLYYLSTGVASAYYEQTLGAIEIFAALLLLSRRTAVIGAGIAASLLINIVLANFAYQLGEHLYSFYLLFIIAIIIAYDAPRLYNLLVKERATKADKYQPERQNKKLTWIARTAFLLFGVFYTTLTYAAHKNSNWPFPDTPGLPKAAGVYDVAKYSYNDKDYPYSLTDSTRWQDVVFERWNELSIRVNRRIPVDSSSPSITYQPDEQRKYASQGNGGRIFYRYNIAGDLLQLVNVNDSSDIKAWHITRPDEKTILLDGTGPDSSLHVQLNKLPKEYLLNKGRRKKVLVN